MSELVAYSPAMRETLAAALDVASTPTTVFITGESGVGKEALARFIHHASPRAALPFTVISGSTLPVALVEQALQHGGTVVFDEVGALTFEAQTELLRQIEQPHTSRVIAITNRNLKEQIERGAYRSDLYYRLDVYPLRMPALRERREDIHPLTDTLLARVAGALGRPAVRLSPAAVGALVSHDFPGNVRELSNVLERAVIRARTPLIDTLELGLKPQNSTLYPAHLPLDLAQLEAMAITEALRRCGGNRTHAARMLGLGLRTLRMKLNAPARGSAEAAEPAPAQLAAEAL
jgi:DNA-binding NtrC family response regulator